MFSFLFSFVLLKKFFTCISPEAVLNRVPVKENSVQADFKRVGGPPSLRPHLTGGGAGFSELSGQGRAPAERLLRQSWGPRRLCGGGRGAPLGWAASSQYVGARIQRTP